MHLSCYEHRGKREKKGKQTLKERAYPCYCAIFTTDPAESAGRKSLRMEAFIFFVR